MIVETKICTKCKKEKLFNDFALAVRRNLRSPKLLSQCRSCMSAADRARRLKRKTENK